MRTHFLTVAVLLQLGSVAGAGSKCLDGCPEPGDIASALAKVRERGWTVWTPAELVKAWPRTLTPLGCQSSRGTCVLLGHKGRSDDASCECCETFQLDQEDRDGKGQERLSAVIVYYSAERYADVLSAARLLAKAMGLPDTEGPAGRDQPQLKPLRQSFEWKEITLQKRAILDLEVSHGRVWTVYLRVAWHPEV